MCHSASYAGLKDWEKAAADAKECIRLEPKFTKGYYRLSTAQLEQKEYDLALATVKQGLLLDTENAQLLKLMRNIKNSQRASTDVQPTSKPLDSITSQELRDLQIQHAETSREYGLIQANLNKIQREQKMNKLTLEELKGNPSAGAHFKSVGKVFLKNTREGALEYLDESIKKQSKSETELSQKLEYLEKRINSQRQNMQELTSSS